MRSVVFWFILAFVGLAIAGPSSAQEKRIDATPFSHAPCSVLDNRPCTPTVCSPLNEGPCIPEIDYPIGQDLRLTIESKPSDQQAPKYKKPDGALETIADLFAALRSCWVPPAMERGREGMEMSVRLSFKRDGRLISSPRLTYATAKTTSQTRDIYRHAIDEAFSHCTPLMFSRGLGGAIAGRPIMIRYVDNRSPEKAIPDKNSSLP